MRKTTIFQPAGDKKRYQRPFSYHKTKPYSIGLCLLCLLLLTWFAGNLAAEANKNTGTSSDSKMTREKFVDETLKRALELRVSGKLEEAAAEWERAFVLDPEYMQQRGGYGEFWVHLFLKLGLRTRALEIFKTGYVGAMPTPESMTSDERVTWGERLILANQEAVTFQGLSEKRNVHYVMSLAMCVRTNNFGRPCCLGYRDVPKNCWPPRNINTEDRPVSPMRSRGVASPPMSSSISLNRRCAHHVMWSPGLA